VMISYGLYEPYCDCAFGGDYPHCFCPGSDYLYFPDDCPYVDKDMSSSTGVAAPTSGGMETATIAAIIFAVIAVAAIAAFAYYKYFRTPAQSDILGLNSVQLEGKTGLLGSTDSNGHNGHNGHSDGHQDQAPASSATGLDYYLAPDTTQATHDTSSEGQAQQVV